MGKNLGKLIENVKNEIIRKADPLSVFLYGSYNTSEYLSGTSDLEIGVIKKGNKSISRVLRKIAENHSSKNVRLRIYSYKLEGLKNLRVDSPFTKSVFVRHLILTSKTIWGEKIMENLSLPPIDLIDAYREACFSTMRALSGLFFLRANKINEAYEMGYKACLFATLSLEYLFGKFPIGFKNIVKNSKKLKLDRGSQKLINSAYNIRLNKIKPNQEEMHDFIFNTITYCNQVVEGKIRKELMKGNRILIK